VREVNVQRVVADVISSRGPKRLFRSVAVSHFLPYLVVGLSICSFAQLVAWLGLGGTGLLAYPFVWAYSQAALLERVLHAATRTTYGFFWAVCYVTLSILLWLLFESRRTEHLGVWPRSLVGWFLAEVAVGVLAWVLYAQGVIQME
jgi:hypothetical protein